MFPVSFFFFFFFFFNFKHRKDILNSVERKIWLKIFFIVTLESFPKPFLLYRSLLVHCYVYSFPSLSVSLSLCLSLFLSLSIYIYTYIYIYISLSLSIYLSIYISIYISPSLSLSPSLPSPSFFISTIYLSIHLFFYLSIYLLYISYPSSLSIFTPLLFCRSFILIPPPINQEKDLQCFTLLNDKIT